MTQFGQFETAFFKIETQAHFRLIAKQFKSNYSADLKGLICRNTGTTLSSPYMKMSRKYSMTLNMHKC